MKNLLRKILIFAGLEDDIKEEDCTGVNCAEISVTCDEPTQEEKDELLFLNIMLSNNPMTYPIQIFKQNDTHL